MAKAAKLSSYSLNKSFTALAFKPTLYAVFQKVGAWLFPLLSKGNQSKCFVKWQLAQESIGGRNMLSNLKRMKTKGGEGHYFLQSKLNCSLHSSMQKVPTRHKDDDNA